MLVNSELIAKKWNGLMRFRNMQKQYLATSDHLISQTISYTERESRKIMSKRQKKESLLCGFWCGVMSKGWVRTWDTHPY